MHQTCRSFSPIRLSVAIAAAVAMVGTLLATPALADSAPARCDIVGTSGPDVLVGTAASNVICGLGGDDVLYGLDGDDELLGGSGNDRLIGGNGNDRLLGLDGTDELFGGPGNDELRGGNDHDNLVGGSGNDEVRGGNGDDTLAGGTGNDVIRGGNGNDIERGSAGNDVLWGGPGDDILRGGAGNDKLRGGPDTDICADTFLNTNGINCEFGHGGDDREAAVAEHLWALNGNAEFVYELAITAPCANANDCGITALPDTVHVTGDAAESSFGKPTFTAAELFEIAADAETSGRKVSFDPVHGLPTAVDDAEGVTVSLSSIELRDELRAQYVQAVEQWNDLGSVDYAYTTEISCFCLPAPPMRVTVANGEATAETLADLAPWSGSAKTIDERLDELGDLLDGLAVHIVAEFDEQGVPTLVSVDENTRIADEERSIRIYDFVDQTEAGEVAEGLEEAAGVEIADESESEQSAANLDIVTVRNIEVSSQIADQVEALLAAAENAGLSLSGGGFRDPQRQIELRKINCGTSEYAIYEMPASECSPPTARPGQSQHEVGLAIDFTNEGHLIVTRIDPAFIWLAANAGTYGFINLPSEPWHFSTTGN